MKEEKESGGRMERLGRFIDDYLPAVVPAFGYGLMGVFGIKLSDRRWYWWVGFGFGFVVSVIGSVLAVRNIFRASQLNARINALNEEIGAERDPKRVFLITSAHTEEWQVFFQHNLLVQLRTLGFRPTVFTPLVNYSPEEQERHFREILERKKDYIGGLVIPIIPERRRDELRKFVEAFGNPIVFVDNAPFEKGEDYPPRTAFVGVSSSAGGELAARAVIVSSSSQPIRKVLVIASNTQVARQNSFKKHLEQSLLGYDVVIDDGGLFSRDQAYNITLKRLQSAIQKKDPFDAIFCTSDSMTLGCLEAIREMGGLEGFREPRVFGYDGIATTIRLADDPKSPLQYVVVQDHHEIAVAAIEQLERLTKGENLMTAVPIFVPPRLYPTLAMP